VRNTRIQWRARTDARDRGNLRRRLAVVCSLSTSIPTRAALLRSMTPGNLFGVILTLQIVALLIGGGIYCLQSVHREKDLNTF